MGRPKAFDPDAAVGAAVELFWRQGYGGTTPAELLDALGIGKGSFYNAFDGKHALFEQALRRYGDERVAGLTAALRGPGSARDRIRAALERLVAPENAHRVRRGCMAVNTAAELGHTDDAAVTIVRSIFDRMEHALQATIEEGQRRGELDRDADPKELASLLLTTLIGMTVLAKTADRPARVERVVRAVMSLL